MTDRSEAGRPRLRDRTAESSALAVWLDENLRTLCDLTDEQLATALGYARPNIISMWRTGRTRIPLDRIEPLSRILGVEPVSLLSLWMEQYMDEAGYDAVRTALHSLASPSEAALLEDLRTITLGRPFRLKLDRKAELAELLEIA